MSMIQKLACGWVREGSDISDSQELCEQMKLLVPSAVCWHLLINDIKTGEMGLEGWVGAGS